MGSFAERLEKAKHFLDDLPQPFLLIGHLDTDGLATTAVLEKILAGKDYSVAILPQLSRAFIKKLPQAASYIFMDGGSALLDDLPTPALVIDHHVLPSTEAENVFVLNPLLDGVDGTKDACSASIACELAELYGVKNCSFLGVLGFTGDSQDKQALTGINKVVRDRAVREGVQSITAPHLFGIYSKPLHKLIMKSGDLRIKGITNDFKGTQAFLHKNNIPAHKTFAELTEDEQEKLIAALCAHKAFPQIEHFGLLAYEKPLNDVRQFATFLNACGRLDKAEVGLAFLRGETPCDPQDLLGTYSGALREATEWAKTQAPKNGLLILNAQTQFAPAIAGTVCSILVRGRIVEKGTVVVCLARYKTGLTKVSIRAREVEANLLDIVSSAAEAVEGESGGHISAAGAIIDSEREQEFIEYIENNYLTFLSRRE